jgi:hypothetical protein
MLEAATLLQMDDTVCMLGPEACSRRHDAYRLLQATCLT